MSDSFDELKIFKSLASPARINILKALEKQPLNYTELMRVAGMDKKTGSGKFAHHLRMLFATGLVRINGESKLYELTPKGNQVVRMLKEMRSFVLESKVMKVKRSNLVLEDFDRNKISKVLIEEAGMPAKTADKIARAVEERLEELKIDGLTSSLIRELVNVYLVEQGMTEYRNRLIRLGLPIADLDKLLEENSTKASFSTLTSNVASAVFKEYVLSKMLPQEIAARYYSGQIDFEGLETWAFSVYSRIYFEDELKSAVREMDAVEVETVFKDPDLEDCNLSWIIECLSFRGKIPTLYFSGDVSLVGLAVRARVLASYEKIIKPAQREVQLILNTGPTTSDGHPFDGSSAIIGKASINLVNVFLNAAGMERKFWDELAACIESIYTAFLRKNSYIGKFWRVENKQFIISMVGVEEIFSKTGISRSELFAETSSECRSISEDITMLLASKSSEKAAERFKRTDIHLYGVRQVEHLAENRHYSINVSCSKASEARDLTKFFNGGLLVKLPFTEAEQLKDLKPLAVLTF
ncbi:MAG: ATP cone domain-containing protein [Candidatus Caldarchaeum sp.]